jgi:magnesium-transporting ATPase (P-type)
MSLGDLSEPERQARVGVTASPELPGLSADQAVARLAADGPNELPVPRPRPAILRLAGELVHAFAMMLWVAAALALIAGLPALSVAIAAVVLLNAGFAFVQEERAGRAAERLRRLMPARVNVKRDGVTVVIDATDVVRGDQVLLEAGDRIPADGEVNSGAIQLDTSMLTGESATDAVLPGHQVWAGTFAVEGAGEMVVTATGGHTRVAALAALATKSTKSLTPLTVELERLVRSIAVIAVTIGLVFFTILLLFGRPVEDGLIVAVGVTVALVPEALLPTVTLSLAWGAEQMSHRNVLVRNLEAVETLGSTTFICTDKTGTLTCNEMTVAAVWTPAGTARFDGVGYAPFPRVVLDGSSSGPSIERVLRLGVTASTGSAAQDATTGRWVAHGEPMDAAIDSCAQRVGVDTTRIRETSRLGHRFPFDPRRRLTSIVVGDRVIVKGAPDAVMSRCIDDPTDANAAIDEFVARGLRVLAVAERMRGGDAMEAERLEVRLELVGLIALEDPPREGVAEALSACRVAGIKVAMLTGDHPGTAGAIARRIGLSGADGLVVIGAELPTDDEELGQLLDRDGVVVARVTPEDKLRIAKALRARGHTVAMTGDGVNDAPSLQEADIGIAMGLAGSDVAREAADLVLLDDHFASIVAGIEQGRATFVNIRRFLTYHLTDNVAELTPFAIWAASGGKFPLALGVMQILALDLGTDTLSAVALGAEPPPPHTLEQPPLGGRLLDRNVARRAFGLMGPAEAVLCMGVFTASLLASGWHFGDTAPTDVMMSASGAAFLSVVLAQTANAFACRSNRLTPWELGWTSNRLLIPAVTVGMVFSLVVLTVPWLAGVLEQSLPTRVGVIGALLSAPAILAVDAIDKSRRHP